MWQTALGRCIYLSASGYKVQQNLSYRWLTLGSPALQTVIHRRKLNKPVLRYLEVLSLLASSYPQQVCLLGLGGGGITHLLPHSPLVAVDNSAEVITIARQFFYIEKHPNLSVIHQNALDFLKSSQDLYPHLLVDLYNANHFPPECVSDEFFQCCKNRLAVDGLIAINLANFDEQWPIFQMIRKQFKTTLVILVKNCANMVIYASINEDKDWLLNKIRETGKVKTIYWVELWGYVGEV